MIWIGIGRDLRVRLIGGRCDECGKDFGQGEGIATVNEVDVDDSAEP